MKTIMILGGGPNQLPLLEAAKKRGYRIVLCDYQEGNPGRVYANIFYCISTLDRDAVLATAKKENPDGITTNSEPAMKVAMWVAHMMELPCNPPEIIEALSRKDLFRSLLKERGLPAPKMGYADTLEEANSVLSTLCFPVMVKPADSSGSRGVSKLVNAEQLPAAFVHAKMFSRIGRVILEEFVERTHDYMIGGDIFVMNGKVVFWGLMNSMRDSVVNPFVPIGTSFPTFLNADQVEFLKKQTQKMITASGLRFGAFNIEMMFSREGTLYVVELNPRNGGNYIPDLLRTSTGFDIFDATVAAAVGDNPVYPPVFQSAYQSTYVVHSAKDGILTGVSYEQKLIPHITGYHEDIKIGEQVERFENADKRIGILFLKFDSREQMNKLLSEMDQLVHLNVV